MSVFTAAVVGVLAAAPSPSPSDVELTEPGAGSPGFLGFVVTFLLAVAAIGLFLSLTKQLRVVDRRAKQLGLDETGSPEGDASTDEAARPGDDTGPRGPGAAGGAVGRDGTR